MSSHELVAYVNGEIVAELLTSDCAQGGGAVRVGARRGARAGAWPEALNQRRGLGRCATAVGAGRWWPVRRERASTASSALWAPISARR